MFDGRRETASLGVQMDDRGPALAPEGVLEIGVVGRRSSKCRAIRADVGNVEVGRMRATTTDR